MKRAPGAPSPTQSRKATKGDLVEVKIGVQQTARELTVESNQTPDEVEAAVAASLSSGSPLRLVDDKGTVLLVPGEKVAYVEIGAVRRGGVGFGKL